MTQIRLAYIQQFTDQHGKMRRYFRRPGCKPVPLPGLPGSTEFMEAYQNALNGMEPKQLDLRRSKPGSISSVIASYYGSADFLRLAVSTQGNHRTILERFREEHGQKPAGTLTKGHVEAMLMKLEHTPAAANHLLNCIRKVMRRAIRLRIRSDDPTQGLAKIDYKERPFHSWTDEEIGVFEERWGPETRARLAFSLLLYTAQRRSDVVRMGPQHLKAGKISLTQKKTGTFLEIPVHTNLLAVIDQHSSSHLAYLMTEYGKPMTEAGFTQWFMECVKKAGLPSRCKPHGLRKAACRRLAEAHCTPHQIMAISGHKSLEEVLRYTRAVDQRRLAESAMATIDRGRHKRGT